MPIVTGTLADIGLDSLAALQAELVFVPSRNAADNSRVFATRPVSVRPGAAGTFTVELAATETLRPDTWYELEVRWLEPSGGYAAIDYPGWKIRVPAAGGVLSSLIDARPTSGQIGFGMGPPTDDADADVHAWYVDISTNPPRLYERSA